MLDLTHSLPPSFPAARGGGGGFCALTNDEGRRRRSIRGAAAKEENEGRRIGLENCAARRKTQFLNAERSAFELDL